VDLYGIRRVATLNALRKFLRDSGCLEERSLGVAGRGSMFIEYRCETKRGKMCRAMLAADAQGGRVPAEVLADIGRRLTPCLGRGWTKRIPEENPFG
jgi:hypothetical protein